MACFSLRNQSNCTGPFFEIRLAHNLELVKDKELPPPSYSLVEKGEPSLT